MSDHDSTKTKSPQYMPGEEVSINLTGKVFVHDAQGLILHRTGGGTYAVPVEDVEITRLTPADGIPKPGELWRDNLDQDWFCYTPDYLIDANDQRCMWTDLNESAGPLTLVYRPGPAVDHIAEPAASPGCAYGCDGFQSADISCPVHGITAEQVPS